MGHGTYIGRLLSSPLSCRPGAGAGWQVCVHYRRLRQPDGGPDAGPKELLRFLSVQYWTALFQKAVYAEDAEHAVHFLQQHGDRGETRCMVWAYLSQRQ